MIKVCVIGDSHIAPLLNLVAREEFPAFYKPIFFGFHTKLAPNLTISERSLVATTDELRLKLSFSSHGLDRIEVDDYDRFIIIGQGLSIGAVARYYRSFVCDRMQAPFGDKYLLSDTCYLELAEKRAMRSEAVRIAKMIRDLTTRPIIIVSCPNPGLGLPETEIPAWFPPCHEIVRNGDDIAVSTLFREVCGRLSDKASVDVIPPIREVAANGLFNSRQYCNLPQIIRPNFGPLQRMNAMVHGSDAYGVHLAKYTFPEVDTNVSVAEA